MAVLQVNYMSQALWRIVPLQVILPADKADTQGNLLPMRSFKTLYLLNGLHGTCTDWVVNTRIRRWAELHNLAVVMPAGDNSYYVDRENGNNRYGEFVGRELVEITRRMFPLSHRREDTFIGGLSMGGFGAILNGLKYHETFGAIVGLSSAMHIFEEQDKMSGKEKGFRESLFGPMQQATESDKNPRVAAQKLIEMKKQNPETELPKIYMAIGTEDFLLESNRTFKKIFEDGGFDLTYIEAPGDHNWDFWDEHIKHAIEWLPLDEKSEGMDSGNIAAQVSKKDNEK